MWWAPTKLGLHIFCWNFAHLFNLKMSTKLCTWFLEFCLDLRFFKKYKKPGLCDWVEIRPFQSFLNNCVYYMWLVSAIFFLFIKTKFFKNYQKCFLFHLKGSFRSSDTQIFVFTSSSLFFPVNQCSTRWLKRLTSSFV